MDVCFDDFHRAISDQNGYALAATITPAAPPYDPGRLYVFVRNTSSFTLQTDLRYAIIYNANVHLSKAEGNAWVDIFAAYWKTAIAVLKAEEDTNQGKIAEWDVVYAAWKDTVNALIRAYTSGVLAAWTIPCLYVAGKYLRVFAIKADKQASAYNGSVKFNDGFQDDVVGAIGKNEKLEDAARQINRIFSLCIGDRAPLEESRKWGLYYITNLLFKTYFKLNSISLSKNIMRSLQASSTDMPPLSAFPKSHRVTFKYYAGVVYFLDEDYVQAEAYLDEARRLCHTSSKRNQELILTYLIPCHLLTTHTLPTPELLARYPRLQNLFGPLCRCIKKGDLAGFDEALSASEDEFVRRRIYLSMERGRDVTLRNLFRKVFLAGGYEPLKEGQEEKDRLRRTRVPIAEFAAALRLGMGLDREGEGLERDEVECMIANMIYKNLMKGYIARERGIVVLSKAGAFPGTGV
ncbi:hypothetical protein BDY21DRAFT_371065 [Lineolata rhizophorae]|uniref:Protein CSN12 homolog n=1 Tax=Lineolata rhizophorae TaxID=578093 RepID=A0A6A6P3Z3_9PEZI|nr:hypothetical protein BDY21DRAFT_371065 [Lineolata rhizophorae]